MYTGVCSRIVSFLSLKVYYACELECGRSHTLGYPYRFDMRWIRKGVDTSLD